MKNYQDKFGNGSYGAYGQGNFIQTLPQPQRVTYGDFSGGLNTKDSREDIQPNSSPNSLDVEVTLRDRLRPVPGTTAVETLTHDATQLVLHASLDYTSELVMFDAPFIGIKTGDTTVWTDVGLPEASRRFAYVNFGGVLLFSNGRVGMYAKEAGKSEVTLVDKAPAAHTFASFAGRVFAGASIIGGNREPLGVSWSGASSDHKEWEPFSEDGILTGAGFELLIDDMAQGNYIVALRTMGLDFLAILLRNSIWIGRRTNQRARPADFQPRVSGVGAVNETSCVVTRFGVVHLHDSGVYLFDGNNSILISEQINSELLPLDRSQLGLYSASYNPTSKQVYLFTPTCTWVYDLERQRWHKRSLIATGASIFTAQIAAITWIELTGTWGDKDEMWEDYKAKETGLPAYLFLSPTGGQLAREDDASSSNFGSPMEPYWEFPLIQGVTLNQLITTKKIFIDYEGQGTVDIFLPDNDSEFVFRRTTTLPLAAAPRLKPTFCEYTGKGVGLRLVFISGKPEILHVQVEFLLRGPRIEPYIPPPPTQFYTDFSSYNLGALPAEWLPVGNASLSIIASPWISPSTGANIALVGGKGLQIIGNSTVIGGALWTVPGNVTDVEITMVFVSSSGTAPSSFYAFARMISALTTSPCFVGGGYTFGQGSGSRSRFDYWDSAAKNQLAIGGGNSIGNNVKIGTRFRITGTGASAVLESRVWIWNAALPDFGESTAILFPAFDLQYIDVGGVAHVTAGMVGLGLFINSPTRQYVVERFGVGVDGSPAPLVPLD